MATTSTTLNLVKDNLYEDSMIEGCEAEGEDLDCKIILNGFSKVHQPSKNKHVNDVQYKWERLLNKDRLHLNTPIIDEKEVEEDEFEECTNMTLKKKKSQPVSPNFIRRFEFNHHYFKSLCTIVEEND
mmetsp:Transcript_10511/g.15366  ORF Transcript_10511/g.15366 Transcript_10511/m.15366 type:complete len:128 (-) Transcript_10511:319-702(-)